MRGDIVNRARKKQINIFSNMLYDRNITPTDIDGFIDFGGALYIIYELKYLDAVILRGQEKALERLVDSTQAGGVTSFLFIARHSVHNPEDDVDASIAIVERYRYMREWRTPREETTLGKAVSLLADRYGK